MVDSDQFRYFLTLGPMTRYAEDLYLAVKIMSAGSKTNLRLDEPVDIAKLNVFYLEDVKNNFGVVSTGNEIRHAISAAAMYLQTRGAKVSQVMTNDTR